MTTSGRATVQLAFALDVGDARQARHWLARVGPYVDCVKVGLQAFVALGPDVVQWVREAGLRCFLDLKLHDIPNTMRAATEAAEALGAEMLTVHAAAGTEALHAVARAARRLRPVAVTVLSSLDDAALRRVGLGEQPPRAAEKGSGADVASALSLQRAELAWQAGIRSFVVSGAACAMLRRRFGPEAFLVVPGIRPSASEDVADDQRRVLTPEQAVRSGADMLVVGRPIRLAASPERVLRRLRAALERAGARRRSEGGPEEQAQDAHAADAP